jgi:glutamine synthetase
MPRIGPPSYALSCKRSHAYAKCGRRSRRFASPEESATAHVHFSLINDEDQPVTGDPSGLGGLTSLGAEFAAGVIEHASALCAVLAPLPVSYLRLRPGLWSSGAPVVTVRDREAFVRICPSAQSADTHLELRAADASSSPYLVIAMLALAGLSGIDAGLRAPLDIGDTAGAERQTLPQSLADALGALEADTVARGWMPPRLLETYFAVKRAEIAAVDGLDDAGACAFFADFY